MALQTPRQRGLQRPSFGTSVSTSAEKAGLSASTAVNRKASLQALTGQGPRTPGSRSDGAELEVGDAVNVPGDMYGTVRFVGTVKGKSGRFVGVELDRQFAARGKNDGDVDGTSYFTPSIPGSGIFLPVHRADKRQSPGHSLPASPNTPTYSTVNGLRTKGKPAYSPPTPAGPPKLSQSVGPGVRPSSPHFKPKRPSLPRPESPFRKQPPSLAPTPARALSQSQRGARPAHGLTTTPSKNNLKASTSRPPVPTPRPYSRTGSRTGHRPAVVDEEDSQAPAGNGFNGRATSTGSAPSFAHPQRSSSRLGSVDGHDAEVQRLKKELTDRDRRLEEQAASLAEMDTSVRELSALLPADGFTPGASTRVNGSLGTEDEQTAAQLRQALREKNEKISIMTHEFDSHRADFRSTLDSLEMASTETERVYEEQKRDLLQQVSELQQENEELKAMASSKEDFDGIVRQLKQLEELVAELEEGLEESRRGEAEARGEVEFLRGEVERGRSELRREREKAAALLEGTGGGFVGSSLAKQLEEKDAENAGLKAIIHSISHANPGAANGYGVDMDEITRLRAALDESQTEKEDLEQALEQLRRDAATANGHATHTRSESERTATAPDRTVPRQRSGTIRAPAPAPSAAYHATNGGVYESPTLPHTTSPADMPAPLMLSPGKENEATAGGKAAADEDKWCALCEKDGHLAFDCPDEQY